MLFYWNLLLYNDSIHVILSLSGRIGKCQGLEFPYISPSFFWEKQTEGEQGPISRFFSPGLACDLPGKGKEGSTAHSLGSSRNWPL